MNNLSVILEIIGTTFFEKMFVLELLDENTLPILSNHIITTHQIGHFISCNNKTQLDKLKNNFVNSTIRYDNWENLDTYLTYLDIIISHQILDTNKINILLAHCQTIIAPISCDISNFTHHKISHKRIGDIYVIQKQHETISHKKKLCLNMIMKNESHIIIEVLQDVVKYIDYYVICDTGSTDNTKQIISDFFKEHQIMGEIIDVPWKNFAYNRSVAIELCKNKCEYFWIIDADDRIMGDLVLPDNLTDYVLLQYGLPEHRYFRPQIFKASINWKYFGVLHEYVQNTQAKTTHLRLQGDYYIDSRRLGHRNKNPYKYEDDAKLLTQALIHEPFNRVYLYYLAQSYRDIQTKESATQAILYYEKYIMTNHDAELVYLSKFAIGILKINYNYPVNEIVEILLDAYLTRKTRLESIFHLLNYLRMTNQTSFNNYILTQIEPINYLAITLSNDSTNVIAHLYEYAFLEEVALLYFHQQDYQKSIDLINFILNKPHLPKQERERITSNRKIMCEKRYTNHKYISKHKLQIYVKKQKPTNILIIEANNGLVNLENTLLSFLSSCLETDIVERVICLNYNIANSQYLQNKYPLLEIIPAHHKNKILLCGEIFKKHTPHYALYITDDYVFINHQNLINDCQKLLNAEIKQIILDAIQIKDKINYNHQLRYGIRNTYFNLENSLIDCTIFNNFQNITNIYDIRKQFNEYGYKIACLESQYLYRPNTYVTQPPDDYQNKITIVTMLYDTLQYESISLHNYLRFFEKILDMDHDLIVFTEDKYAEMIKTIRSKKKSYSTLTYTRVFNLAKDYQTIMKRKTDFIKFVLNKYEKPVYYFYFLDFRNESENVPNILTLPSDINKILIGCNGIDQNYTDLIGGTPVMLEQWSHTPNETQIHYYFCKKNNIFSNYKYLNQDIDYLLDKLIISPQNSNLEIQKKLLQSIDFSVKHQYIKLNDKQYAKLNAIKIYHKDYSDSEKFMSWLINYFENYENF